MPEPDFDQLATSVLRDYAISDVSQDVQRRIAAELRHVWNARGAADALAIDERLALMWATIGPAVVADEPNPPSNVGSLSRLVASALRTLDR